MVLNKLHFLVTAGERFQVCKTRAPKALVFLITGTCSKALELLLMCIDMEDYSKDADDLKLV